ncbi:MAG: hypothetical protein ACXVA2_21460 [Mucilaginibacter sp.]
MLYLILRVLSGFKNPFNYLGLIISTKKDYDMRPQSQIKMATKSQVFDRHLQRYLHETSMTLATFATTVREHYQSNYASHDQVIEWSHHPDVSERPKLDGEKLKNWLSGVVVKKQVSVDLDDSFIAAFPPERRFRLQMELAGRQGMMVIPMPFASPSEGAAHLGRIAKETGEALIALSPLFDDGHINGRDKDKAPAAISEINEAIAALLSAKALIEREALGKSSFVIMGVDLMTPPKADPTKID